jgi:hypothetical protein
MIATCNVLLKEDKVKGSESFKSTSTFHQRKKVAKGGRKAVRCAAVQARHTGCAEKRVLKPTREKKVVFAGFESSMHASRAFREKIRNVKVYVHGHASLL